MFHDKALAALFATRPVYSLKTATAIFAVLIMAGFGWLAISPEGGGAFNVFRVVLLPLAAMGIFMLARLPQEFGGVALVAHRRMVLAAMTGYAVLMGCLKWLKLSRANYEFFDAGLYYNRLWKIADAPLGDGIRIALTEGHFQPVNIIFALVGNPGLAPVIAFMVETAAFASGMLAVYLLALHLTKHPLFSLVLAFSYILNPLVHFNDILGYHPDHLVLPCLLWGFYFLERGRNHFAVAAFAGIWASSEPWIPLVITIGLYLALSEKTRKSGVVLALASMLLFILVIAVILPSYQSINSADSVFVKSGPYAVISDPGIDTLIAVIADPRKYLFVFFVFLPFLFLPLMRFGCLLIMAPDFFKLMLSNEPLHYAVEGHYTLSFIAVGYWGLCKYAAQSARLVDLGRLRLSVLSLAASLALSIGHGVLPHGYNFWGEISSGTFHHRNYSHGPLSQDMEELAGMIGSDASLSVEVSNGAFAPWLGARQQFRHFPTAAAASKDLIVIENSSLLTAGYERNLWIYQRQVRAILEKLETCFAPIELRVITAFRRRPDCPVN